MEYDFLLSVRDFFWTPEARQLLVAAGLGALIGIEREIAGKDPSIRTFALISMGSCMFSILSLLVAKDSGLGDPGRVAAQIVPGIGFLGAGTIFRSKTGVSGFTTAALMWVTAGIGMAVGFKHSDLALTATLTAIAITLSLRLIRRLVRRRPVPVRAAPQGKVTPSDDV
jgi:putative Mg2+ transporter-C (MgtC) family protein